MTTTVTPESPAAADHGAENYLNHEYGIKSWLLTVDHKRIGLLYLITTTMFFALGGVFAGLIRLELMTPQGDMFQADTYNKLFTMHGVAMIFFFLIPSVPAVLGNFVLPLMIGAKDVAFPRLNLLSWYCYITGGSLATFAIVAGGVDTGWTFYTPYSSTYSDGFVALALTGVFINGFSSILTGVNFLTTIHKMRAPGMTWFRLPLFIWAHYATSLMMILGTPVVAITLLLVALENLLGIGIFNPDLGGDPILMQHLFWFYSHPAVYIMIVPGFGVISEVIACFSRKAIFGYSFVAFSSLAIALLGFLVWGHHMFTTGQSVYASMVFSFITFFIAVPTAVKIFNWTATMYRGSIDLKTPMLYAIGFMGLFLIGGLTGTFLSTLAMDVHLHDTYFVVSHFHYVMVGGMVMAYLSGLHFWWPKMTGRLYDELMAKTGAVLIFLGFNLTFFPQFVLGYLGMPRRYHVYPEEFQILHVASTGGATVLGLGYIIMFGCLIYSLFRGAKAGPNPWTAKGLEWEIESPPIAHNFHETPIVTSEPYAYEEEDVLLADKASH
ncbi:MAG: cytochrome c oxidase subunit I [Gemmatimonadetes bacterium]|jgi:cytochrome c oxidase subunit I|nr:cytochrome c oxidase subunit I [Gemmatimonadota bacterium]MBT5141858.1 cytochrome c oxidase subunit I [Gemmatimonadota bacterium]MBT5589853.1 cytochrome c oxidase subunit I [Gemmatimonadota bacterium]MBT5963971.1 cytochrome c oxidase subunit I [Gemmatimonadota bacterium]MBT6627612.1 cytochrome c oxidase subunit I [Gemmatimonadota bacterium]